VYSRAEFNSTSALVERIVVAKGQETSVRAAHDLLRTREPPIAYSSVLRTPMTASSTSPATLGLHAISAALQQTLHNVSSATMLLSRRQEALVIVPSGNVLNTIVRLQKRLNAVRSGLFPEVH